MQHRRVYLDDWSLLEKICLVSAVYRYGENNWSTVCDLLKSQLQEERQWDWFTVEACEAQYKQLYNEYVKSHVSNEKPVFQIIRSLKSRCKIEGQPAEEQRKKYINLKKILESLAKDEVTEEHLEKYYERAQQGILEREENNRKYQELLKRRDTLKTEFEKSNTKSPNKPDTRSDGASPLTTSPLLSSLLNNPPAVQYRPTLSTASFVPTKTSQSTSRTSTADKIPPIDINLKDSFLQDLEPSSSAEKQSVLPTSSAVRRLDFQDVPSTSSTLPKAIRIKEPAPLKQAAATSTPLPKNDQQNLENMSLISPDTPDAEGYLGVVDIPQEDLLEVIDKLKEGTILEKLIRDLEGGDATVMDKEETNTASIGTEISKPSTESQPPANIPVTQNRVETNLLLPEITEVKNVIQEPKVITESTSKPVQELAAANLEQITTDRTNVETVSSLPETENDGERVTRKEHEVVMSSEDTESNNELGNSAKESHVEPVVSVEQTIKNETSKIVKSVETNIINTVGSQESRSEIENLPTDSVSEGGLDQNNLTPEIVQQVEEGVSIEQSVETRINEERSSKVSENKQATELSLEKPVIVTELQEDSEALNNEVEKKTAGEEKEKKVDTNIETRNPTAEKENTDIDQKITAVEPLLEKVHAIQPVLTESSAKTSEKQFEVSKDKPVSEDVPPNWLSNIPGERKEVPKQHEVNEQKEAPKSNVLEQSSVIKKRGHEVEEKTIQDESKDIASQSKLKRLSRKRKNTSESREITAKTAKISPEVAENPEIVKEDTANSARELNITIQDIKDGGLDPQIEEELLKPKEEAHIGKEAPRNPTPSKKRSERETRNSESRRSAKPRRSSTRTKSPMPKTEVPKPVNAPKPMDDQELAKTRKKSIMLAYSRLMSHKYSNAFQKPITNKQVPGYENVIYQPMDLHTIKKKIDNKQIGSMSEFQRDVLLMLNNAKMFNQTNSQVYNMAVEVEKDTLDHLQLTVKALSEGVLIDFEKTDEKIRKRQSMEPLKKDGKTKKRSKSSMKEDAPPAKMIKLEDNDNSENQSKNT